MLWSCGVEQSWTARHHEEETMVSATMERHAVPEPHPEIEPRPRLWRSRWAAIGAAVAVSLGGGGLFVANAASGPTSNVVLIDPVRILDTRDPVNVGLPGPFVSPIGQKLQVTGSVPTTAGPQVAVPTGATGVLLNVTGVNATANGFISVRPGNATGAPLTSSLNITAGVTVPNAVTVSLPTAGPNAGQIDITWDALGVAGRTTDILVDVVGYTTAETVTGGPGFAARGTNLLAFGTINTDQTVASVDLPAGSYIVSAKLVINNNDAAIRTFGCSLRVNTTVIDNLFDANLFPISPSGSGGERETVTLMGAGTLAAPGTANVVCRTSATTGNYLARSITAIQVSSATGGAAALIDGDVVESSE
jgi:hypothetical protein